MRPHLLLVVLFVLAVACITVATFTAAATDGEHAAAKSSSSTTKTTTTKAAAASPSADADEEEDAVGELEFDEDAEDDDDVEGDEGDEEEGEEGEEGEELLPNVEEMEEEASRLLNEVEEGGEEVDEEDEGGEDEEEGEGEEVPFDDAAVVKLNAVTVRAQMNKKSLTLLEFYAPWCGHCRELAPEYNKVAKHFNTAESQVLVAKIDATDDVSAKFVEKHNVQGFPTIKLFTGNNIDEGREYTGERTADAMIRFVNMFVGPAVTELRTNEELTQFVDKDRDTVAVVAFMPTEGASATVFAEVADERRDRFRFARVRTPELATQHNVTTPGIVLMRANNEERVQVFRGDTTARSEVVDWLLSAANPVFGELTFDNANDYLVRNKPFVLLFVDYKKMSRADVAKLVGTLRPTAAKYGGELSFVYLDNEQFGSHQSRLGLEGSTPALAIDDYIANTHYTFRGDLTPERFEEFVSSFVMGTLKPHLRSEPIPEKNDEPVKVVVGDSFHDIVMNPSKDVLIEFYAPWCGHCKKLAPTYEELARSVSHVPTLVIAKMDATVNDPPSFVSVEGFPTIMLFRAGDKKNPVIYEGKRKLENMQTFLSKKCTHTFSLSAGDTSAPAAPAAADAPKKDIKKKTNKAKKDEL